MHIKLRQLLSPAWEAWVLWIGVRDRHAKLNVYLKWPEEKETRIELKECRTSDEHLFVTTEINS